MSTAIDISDTPPLEPAFGENIDQWEPQDDQRPRWNPIKRFLFRFCLIYFVLYTPGYLSQYITAVPSTVNTIVEKITEDESSDGTASAAGGMGAAQNEPSGILKLNVWVGKVLQWYGQGTTASVDWVGEKIFKIEDPIPHGPSGSGDRTENFITLFIMVVVSLFGALIWSLIDLRRLSYPTLSKLLIIAARYYLAIVLLGYGFHKVWPLQMQMPGFQRLLTEYGERSPMGIVWSFMGNSPAYTMFSGWGEVIAGLLLLFRPTRTLGALVGVGVMSNVVMLNYCYDVPVKLFSSHLLLMLIIIALLDWRRLLNVLMLNRTAYPIDLSTPFTKDYIRYPILVLKVVCVSAVLFQQIYGSMQSWSNPLWGPGREKPALYGLYDVTKFVRDGEELPPLTTDTTRWQNMFIESERVIGIRLMDDSFSGYGVTMDHEAKTFTLRTNPSNPEDNPVLHYEKPTEDTFVLTGHLEGSDVRIEFSIRDLDTIQLLGSKFRWINEFPHHQ